MKKIIAFVAVLTCLSSFKGSEESFSGKILYQYTFTDLSGKDMTDKMTPFVGKEQHYFISGKNYKAYDENNNLTQLYNAETNTYYSVNKDKTAQKLDGATVTSQRFEVKVKNLAATEKIAGYDCKSVQIETDGASTIYYYSPKVKIDAKVFAKHSLGEWNKYLETTQGCLALKYVMTNTKNGFIWTATAAKVEKQALPAKDFELPKDIQIK